MPEKDKKEVKDQTASAGSATGSRAMGKAGMKGGTAKMTVKRAPSKGSKSPENPEEKE